MSYLLEIDSPRIEGKKIIYSTSKKDWDSVIWDFLKNRENFTCVYTFYNFRRNLISMKLDFVGLADHGYQAINYEDCVLHNLDADESLEFRSIDDSYHTLILHKFDPAETFEYEFDTIVFLPDEPYETRCKYKFEKTATLGDLFYHINHETPNQHHGTAVTIWIDDKEFARNNYGGRNTEILVSDVIKSNPKLKIYIDG